MRKNFLYALIGVVTFSALYFVLLKNNVTAPVVSEKSKDESDIEQIMEDLTNPALPDLDTLTFDEAYEVNPTGQKTEEEKEETTKTILGSSAGCLASTEGAVYDYFASPLGTGDGSSEKSPFKIADFWKVAKPGDTLGLLDGKYTGAISMINPPDNFSGEKGKPIVIRAINEGKVYIDGEGKRVPVQLEKNNWFVLEGFNAHNAGGSTPSESVVELKYSSNNIVRCVAAWDAGDGNSNIFGVHHGKYNLLEDVAGWGIARKIFSNSQGGDYTTFRRAWGRWDGGHTEGPKKVFTLSYNSVGALCENCLATWGSNKMKKSYELTDYEGKGLGEFYDNYTVYNPEGIISADSFDGDMTQNANIRVFGSIAYLPKEARYHNFPRNWAGPFSMDINGVKVENSIAIVEPGAHENIFPVNFGSDFSQKGNNILKNMTIIGNAEPRIDSVWSEQGMYKADSCSEITKGGGSIVNPKSGVINGGAKIMKQYVNGVETSKDLWPWPMNQRIIDAMKYGGYEPVDVTKEIFDLCKNGVASEPEKIVENEVMPITDDIIAVAKAWLAGSESVRRGLEEKLKSWHGDIDAVIAKVKPSNYIETKTGEIFYQDFKIPELAQKYKNHKYHMYVPAHYKPGTPIGAMLWLHGGGSCESLAEDLKHLEDYDMDDETVTGRSPARTEVDTSNYILIAPVGPCGSLLPHPEHASRWDAPIADQYLMDILTEVDQRYNINENKIILGGFSMGGIGAYHMALRLSDRFSAVMASAGAWELGSWADLINTPMYLIQGANDAHYYGPDQCRPHNTAIEYARMAYKLLGGANSMHKFYEYPGEHGWDDTGYNAWVNFLDGQNGWVTTKARDPYEKHVIAINSWRSYDVGSNFGVTWTEDPSPDTMWVSINSVGSGTISYDYARVVGDGSCDSESAWKNWSLVEDKKYLNGARADAKITGPNQISITTQNVESLSVWLHPKMGMDFSKPISITLDEVTSQMTCTPSLLDALRSYERRQDWQMIYQCELDVK